MSDLIRLKDIQDTQRELIGDDYYDPTGKTAFATGNEKVGKVEGALVESVSGLIRYLIVDVGGWFNTKQVLIPAGLARIVGDDIYFDSLTKDQVDAMEEYDNDYRYTFDEQYDKDRALFASETLPENQRLQVNDDLYKAPSTLELLEERLIVNKDRIVAGLVSVGKHVVTEDRKVDVALEEEHAHIERTNVDRRVDRKIGDDLGADTIEVELEAERARVGKETYVTEEVRVGKTTEVHTETVHETIKREELDVDGDGNIINREGQVINPEGINADDVRAVRGR